MGISSRSLWYSWAYEAYSTRSPALLLSQYDTGQWEDEEIDFVFSGKDADLQSSNHGVWLNGYVVEEGQRVSAVWSVLSSDISSRPEGKLISFLKVMNSTTCRC